VAFDLGSEWPDLNRRPLRPSAASDSVAELPKYCQRVRAVGRRSASRYGQNPGRVRNHRVGGQFAARCLERGEGLTRWRVSRTPPHPQSAEQKGAKEDDNADEQQEQQALGDDTYDA
jgi:hypothetical protein